MATLSAQEIYKSYKSQNVVKGISLDIQSGEVVGLLGPNGAGKTTAFYIIVGLITADSGSIFLDGKNITHLPIHRRAMMGLGYLQQEASIIRKLTVEQNILAILETRPNLSKEDREQDFDKLLEELHVGHVRSTMGSSLSGGERRRVEIARALAANPQFVLLDEPFAGGDLLSIQDIKGLLLKLQARGCAVLVTDHNASQLLSVVDRAYVLANGTIVANGPPRQIVNTAEAQRLYFGSDFKL